MKVGREKDMDMDKSGRVREGRRGALRCIYKYILCGIKDASRVMYPRFRLGGGFYSLVLLIPIRESVST